MKRKLLKGIGCLLTAVCLLGMDCMAASAAVAPVSSVEDLRQYDTDGDGMVYAIIGEEEMVTGPLANQPGIATMAAQNGQVIENGVRLRNKPSTTTGTILELMYKGEAIYIDLTTSTSVSGGWYYLKRLKTGTWGWASSKCIYSYF